MMVAAPPARTSQTPAPCFSVLITSRHGSRSLAQALGSVNEQTFRDYEIIVADSSPSDDVTDVVRAMAPRAQLIRLDPRCSAAEGRNAALADASGQYVAFLDSADAWHPGYLQYHYAANRAVPTARFTFADYFLRGPIHSGPVRQFVSEPQAENALLHMVMRPFVHFMSCFVAPCTDVAAVKGFDPELGRYAEIDLCVRLLAGRPGRKGLACLARPALSVPQVLAVKRAPDDLEAIDDEIAEWEGQR
ncbi:MAG: glycosyltransferase family 2 protein, partial [Dongiaceae bacterium]